MTSASQQCAVRERMARKYVWWKAPGEALAEEPHFLAMLMTYGTLEDVQWMLANFSAETLRHALSKAPPGVFNARSWHFWHAWLTVQPVGPMPTRSLPP